MLTVEAFLRRSAEKPQKKYGNRNRKRRIADLDPVCEGLVPILVTLVFDCKSTSQIFNLPLERNPELLQD